MPTLSLLNVLLVLVAYLSYRIISSIVITIRFKAFAQKNGCEEPVHVTGSFLDGFTRLRRILYALIKLHSC